MLSGYASYQDCVIDMSGLGASTSGPIAMQVPAAAIAACAYADGRDFRPTLVNDTVLDYWFEGWANGIVWVLVPNTGNTSLTVRCQVGKSGVTDGQNVGNVFAAYTSVWPMSEASGNIIDVKNGYNGTPSGSPSYGVTGKVGKAIAVAPNAYFDCGNITEINAVAAFTIDAWISHAAGGGSFIGKSASTGESLYMQMWSNDYYYFSSNFTDGGPNTFRYASGAPPGWHHHMMVFDGNGIGNPAKLKYYVDGVLLSASDYDALLTVSASNSAGFRIGMRYSGGNPYYASATYDTVRLSTVSRGVNDALLAATIGYPGSTKQAWGSLQNALATLYCDYAGTASHHIAAAAAAARVAGDGAATATREQAFAAAAVLVSSDAAPISPRQTGAVSACALIAAAVAAVAPRQVAVATGGYAVIMAAMQALASRQVGAIAGIVEIGAEVRAGASRQQGAIAGAVWIAGAMAAAAVHQTAAATATTVRFLRFAGRAVATRFGGQPGAHKFTGEAGAERLTGRAPEEDE